MAEGGEGSTSSKSDGAKLRKKNLKSFKEDSASNPHHGLQAQQHDADRLSGTEKEKEDEKKKYGSSTSTTKSTTDYDLEYEKTKEFQKKKN